MHTYFIFRFSLPSSSDVLINQPRFNIFLLFHCPQLFAPTNSAWSSAALSYGVPLDQLLSSRNVVRDILFTHIVPNTILDSATLLTLPSFIPQSGSVVFVAPPAGPGGPAMLVSVASTARIITPDAASGCNYVIHKVDSVMSPNPSPQGGMNPAYQSALARGRASAGR